MSPVELMQKFPDELTAIKYFETVRWGDKPKCTHCKSENIGNRGSDYRLRCKTCNRRFSARSGTLLDSSNIPFRTWLMGLAIICDAKKGISALQLSRNLSVSYETAWTMYHRLREFMSIETKSVKLDGIVEMDETYVGGKPRRYESAVYGGTTKEPKRFPELDEQITNLSERFDFQLDTPYKKRANSENAKRGRGTDKTPVVGLVSRDGDVVAEVVLKTGATNLRKLVQKYVILENSVLLTDAYKSYSRFNAIISHVAIDHNQMYSYRGLNTNTIESFWAIVKRGIMGQYHHVSDEFLTRYIDEFCFKYNNRKVDDMFETIVKIMMLEPSAVVIPKLPILPKKLKSTPKATAKPTKTALNLKTKTVVVIEKLSKSKPKTSKKDDYLPF